MSPGSDLAFVEQHRAVWARRPELRAVYHDFFKQLLVAVGERTPVVELGSGPGFFKQLCPSLISTDVISTCWVDLVCDGCALPFPGESVGALVMLDVLHHLPRPLEFMREAARVLRPGGIVAMIEPWITPASYILYRYFHHEDCTLRVDIHSPFESSSKNAFDGNATIPYNVVGYYSRCPDPPLQLARKDPFLGLPYLATLGFKRQLALPSWLISAARACEKAVGPLGRWNATRVFLVWRKSARGSVCQIDPRIRNVPRIGIGNPFAQGDPRPPSQRL
jgi:SAM-dependent methyltransferase